MGLRQIQLRVKKRKSGGPIVIGKQKAEISNGRAVPRDSWYLWHRQEQGEYARLSKVATRGLPIITVLSPDSLNIITDIYKSKHR